MTTVWYGVGAAVIAAVFSFWFTMRVRKWLALRAGRRIAARNLVQLSERWADPAQAPDGAQVVLEGRLVVRGDACRTHDGKQGIAAWSAFAARTSLGASAEFIGFRKGRKLALDTDAGKLVELLGPVRVRVGSAETWTAGPVRSVPSIERALGKKIEIVAPRHIVVRSLSDSDPVAVKGYVTRGSGDVDNQSCRELAATYRLQPDPPSEDANQERASDGAWQSTLDLVALAPPWVTREHRWFQPQAIGAAVVLGTLAYAGVTVVPARMLEALESESVACFDALKPSHPRGCLFLADSSRLALLKLLPWVRKDAEGVASRIQSKTANRQLRAATAHRPNREERQRAAKYYEHVQDDETVAERHAWLSFMGAQDEINELPTGETANQYAYWAALLTADASRAETVAALPPGKTLVGDPRLGAFLCLRGKREEGLKALARADVQADWRQRRVRLAIVLCGGNQSDVGFDPTRFDSNLPRILKAHRDPSYQRGRRVAFFRTLAKNCRGAECLSIISASLSEGNWSLERALELLTWSGPRRAAASRNGTFLGATSVFSPKEDRGVDVQRLEKSAAFVARLAEAAPDSMKDREDLQYVVTDRALEDPRGTLQAWSHLLWAEAAVEWLRRGKVEHAVKSARQADQLAPVALAWRTAAIYLGAGEPEAALAATTRALDASLEFELGIYETAFIGLLQAYAYADLGRYEDGLKAARKAQEMARQDPQWNERHRKEGELFISLTWLRAALAYRIGKQDVLFGVPAGAGMEPDKSFEMLNRVLEALRAPNRAERREAMADTSIDIPLALDAGIYLMGETVEGQGDPEVYLDRVFVPWHDKVSARAYIAARYRAARWRGDENAAARWRERMDKLAALVPVGPEALLAHIAGL